MAWYGLQLLDALADGPKLTRELADAVGAADIKRCLRTLRARGLIMSCEGIHSLTAQGIDAVDARLALTSGPCSAKVATRQRRTLRDKAWSAMRQRDFFDVPELLQLLVSEGDGVNEQGNLQSYVSALVKVGYLACKAVGGCRRYRLRREMDTGPRAPAWNKATRTITDVNTGRRYAVPGKTGVAA